MLVGILNVFRQPHFPITCAPPVNDSTHRGSLYIITNPFHGSTVTLSACYRKILFGFHGKLALGRSGIGTVTCSSKSVLLVSITPTFPELYFIHASLLLYALTKWPDINEETAVALATINCQSFIFRQRVRGVIISDEKGRVLDGCCRNVQKWRKAKNGE